jgi:hypothetical protein
MHIVVVPAGTGWLLYAFFDSRSHSLLLFPADCFCAAARVKGYERGDQASRSIRTSA